jgi:hypothetical protein
LTRASGSAEYLTDCLNRSPNHPDQEGGMTRPTPTTPDRALCRAPGANAAWWDHALDEPAYETPPVREARHAIARAVCAQCSLRNECLARAIVLHQRGVLIEGIYSGVLMPDELPEQQRRRTVKAAA